MNYYYEMKRRLMYFQNHSKNPGLREFWRRRVVFCNRKIGQLIAAGVKMAVVLVLIAMIAGCHTVSGFGKDLQDWTHEYTQRDTEK